MHYAIRTVSKSLVVLATLAIFSPVNSFADATKAKQLFSERCSSCHGAEGKGDGPAAVALPPDMKPADLATGKYKFATDEAKFKELLSKGGIGVGLSPLMPMQAGLGDEDIKSLYELVKSFHK